MQNETFFQFFHWYYSAEGNLWQHAKDQAAHLASLGITWVWLPPAYKSAQGTNEPGYAVYDLFDLGEFDQKGTVRTRYGTKAEYLEAIRAFHDNGINVFADIVLNHRTGGDEQEDVPVHKVAEEDRNESIGEKHTARAHTKFTFPGRKGKYSTYKWDWHSFTGFCEDGDISVIHNEYGNGSWEDMLSDEKGNYDYLMGCDVEFRNPNVREELKHWGVWYVETTGVDGFRLDALKHISPDFFPEWLDHLRQHFKKDFFTIGEYWKNDPELLTKYIEVTGHQIQLFDVPLHFNFHVASREGKDYDLSQIMNNSLVNLYPERTVTFVDNHDTQPLQSLQSPVEEWFKPIAYTLIMLREHGIPCVFYPVVYEGQYVDHSDGQEVFVHLHRIENLENMMKVRTLYAYGPQSDYLDHPNVIGWIRHGDEDKPHSGCAVVASNSDDGFKEMSFGEGWAGKELIDVCGGNEEEIVLNETGTAIFPVRSRSISVWITKEAAAGLHQ